MDRTSGRPPLDYSGKKLQGMVGAKTLARDDELNPVRRLCVWIISY